MIIENIANVFPDSKLIIPKANPIPALMLTMRIPNHCLENRAAAIVAWIPIINQSNTAPNVARNPSPTSSKNVIMMNGILMIT
jgi:hypothetical protein